MLCLNALVHSWKGYFVQEVIALFRLFLWLSIPRLLLLLLTLATRQGEWGRSQKMLGDILAGSTNIWAGEIINLLESDHSS